MEKNNTMSKKFNRFFNEYSIIIIFAVMVAILAVLKPQFIAASNIISMIRQVSLIGILAMGMMLVIINGGVDLSAGAQIALVSVVCSLFAQETQNNLLLAIILSIAMGLFCGLVNGILITGPKIPPFIATLGMTNIAKGMALLFCDGQPIQVENKVILWLGSYRIGSGDWAMPVLILIFLGCALINHIVLRKTHFGKKVYALGGNEQAARVCGVSVEKTRICVYLLLSLYAAIAGILISGRVGAGATSNGIEYHLDAIASCVIGGVSMKGGVGNVLGVVVGVLIMGALQNGLNIMGVSPYWQQICKGLIIIVAVVADTMKKGSDK
ncbi:ABC transporter permease [Hominiventricola filiformis]|uniref:ABC transporter permease n=1 Tax=Hominiventricola filiformis TaxID=2885352 RepID=A0AAE3AA79_9FIRM|nr:ABC transporter permease [Hominiventricola filiformis]MCC2127454.1 ABC transporter permease [Hominiventricola filiformis]